MASALACVGEVLKQADIETSLTGSSSLLEVVKQFYLTEIYRKISTEHEISYLVHNVMYCTHYRPIRKKNPLLNAGIQSF